MRVHKVWFKPTADRLAKDYCALGYTVRIGILPKNGGYEIRAWK